jgi:hypothetical protein
VTVIIIVNYTPLLFISPDLFDNSANDPEIIIPDTPKMSPDKEQDSDSDELESTEGNDEGFCFTSAH